MAPKPKKKGPSLPLYIIPIMLGLCGVLFAGRLPGPSLQITVILISVGGPLFAVGLYITRIHSSGYQRIILTLGVIMLLVGALVMVSRLPESVTALEDVPDEAGAISRILGIGSLVVGLVALLFIIARREEEAEAMSQQFRYLADHMSEGFVLSGSDGAITLVNQALTDLTGLEHGDLMGKDIRALADQLELRPIQTGADMRRKGAASEFRITWKRDNRDRELWVQSAPIFDRQGRFAGTVATVRDVTEQVELSRRLERYTHGLQQLVEDRTQKMFQSQRRLRDLLMRMNEGFLTIDHSFHIRFANTRLSEMLQLVSGEAEGKDFFQFVESTSRGRLLELLDAAGEESLRPNLELNLVTKIGEAFPVMVSVARIEEAPEDEARFSLVVTDVGDLKRMQAQLELRAIELEEANAELRMLDRAKDSFLTNVSHELRTPLTTVRGYVEMLQSTTLGRLDPQQTSALAVMTRNLERLGNLIDEMIEFGRMETRGVQLHYSVFALSRLVNECAAAFRPQLLSRGLRLDLENLDDAGAVWGDRKRINQVLAIFLSNAAKFSDAGDTITIRASRGENDTLKISVADTGIGIDRHSQKRVFDKFFQADSSLARRYEGAGIGLSIARSIVAAHGGRIELDSQLERGSTFTIVMPRAIYEFDRVRRDTRASDHRVLVVAAEEEFGYAMTQSIGRAGHSAISVTGGYEASRMVHEVRPDLVVLDSTTIDIDGLSLVGRLREDPAASRVPIVFLADENLIRQDGFPPDHDRLEVLAKPFSPIEFVHVVTERMQTSTGASTGDPAMTPKRHRVSALAVSGDSDLLEWIRTALRLRNIACLTANTFQDATRIVSEFAPAAILVDADTLDILTEPLASPYIELAMEAGAKLWVLAGPGQFADPSNHPVEILHKPFSLDALADAVNPAGTVRESLIEIGG